MEAVTNAVRGMEKMAWMEIANPGSCGRLLSVPLVPGKLDCPVTACGCRLKRLLVAADGRRRRTPRGADGTFEPIHFGTVKRKVEPTPISESAQIRP
jgi:hypothetical protein